MHKKDSQIFGFHGSFLCVMQNNFKIPEILFKILIDLSKVRVLLREKNSL